MGKVGGGQIGLDGASLFDQRPPEDSGQQAALERRGEQQATPFHEQVGESALRQPSFRIGEDDLKRPGRDRSEEHTSELQSHMRISYAVFCLKKKKPSTYKLLTITIT